MSLRSNIKKLLKWDEPMGLNTSFAVGTGCFRTIAPPLSARRFFYYHSQFQLSMIVVVGTFAFINIFTSTDFFGDFLEALRLTQSALIILSKFLVMRWKERQFVDLFDRIRTSWDSYCPRNREFLAKYRSSANKFSLLIFVVIMACAVVNVLVACVKHISDPDAMHFPRKIWIPPFCRNSFLWGSLSQLVPYFPALMVYIHHISFLYNITTHIEALGLALARDISCLQKWEGEEVKEIYKKHQELIRIIEILNELMSSNWGFEMFGSSVQLTLVAYTTFTAFKRRDISFYNESFTLFVTVAAIYLIFGCGNRIILMGEEIHDSLYTSNWIKSSIKERKNFLFMLFRSTYPLEYRYKILHFDLPSFALVVNTMFSYMALIQFLDESGEKGNTT